MSFKPKNETTNPLFRNLKIIKFKDIVAYNNCIFVHEQLNENLLKSFNKFFTTAPAQHNYNTRGSHKNTIIKSITNSVIYGLYSVKHRAASDWNAMIKDINTIGIDGQDLMKTLRGIAYNKSPSWAYVGSWGSSDFDDVDISYGVH